MKAVLWLVAAAYFAVAALGGSIIGAVAAVVCGYFAGRAQSSNGGAS